jgi:leader peptidase (prepilin peptidase)/N-methyltransferase
MWIAFVWGAFGLIAGSFLNVVVLRRGAGSLFGRSACLSCGTQIRAYDLVPVLSWLILRGRCRACGSRISVQYPLVEAATSVLFACIGGAPVLGVGYKLVFCVVAALLVAIAAYDMRHTIIPDAWVYAFIALALGVSAPLMLQGSGGSIGLYLLAGPASAMPLFILWLVSRGAWMGFGDVKLSLGIGWLLGPIYGFFAVFLAFIIGAIISVFILLPLPHLIGWIRKRGIARLSGAGVGFTMKSEVPFGPFLIASCCIVWFMLLYHIPLPL